MENIIEYLTNLSEPFVLEQLWIKFEIWLIRDVLVLGNLIQLTLIGFALVVSHYLAPRARAGLERLARRPRLERGLAQVCRALAPLMLPILWLGLQWLTVLVAVDAGWEHNLVKIVVSLLTAWVIIRFAAQLVRDPAWSRLIAISAWAIAALNIVGLLGETLALLDSLGMQVGGLRITALTVIKGVASLAVLLWLASILSGFLERRIVALPNLTPSVQVLFAKLLKIVLVTIAIVAALSSVGIDLTAFAVFSGAVGVGIGFGLQKIVSNLISGVILLMDRSIKPGDVISVSDTYGWINTLGARYASVVTRDGMEFLIPNEDLITQQVVNWSYSNNAVRLRIPVGISYDCDIRKARDLCLEAAAEVSRVVQEPKSVCLLKGFGDSAVDLELRIWIVDPQNGVSNVRSEVLFKIWDKFREHKIEIPFPQRVLHIQGTEQLRVGAATPTDGLPEEAPG